MKKFAILLIVAVCSFSLVTIALSAAAPKGKITVSVSGKKPVSFDHAAHLTKAGGDCQKCHHKDAKGQGSKCSTCHTETGKDKAIPGKEAFHKQCADCHKTLGKGPQYPKDCKGCHAG